MASLNQVNLLGNCGRDPDVRYTTDGAAITNVSIATTRSWKNKEGEKQEETEWHRLSFFGRLAEIAAEYLKKGDPVLVTGRLRTRKWEDKDGNERHTTEIVVEQMQLLGGKRRAGDDEPDDRPRASSKKNESRQGSTPLGPDDDIPFNGVDKRLALIL